MTPPDRLADQAAMAEPLSELELLKRELHLMKTAGIIEVAVRNPSVAEYMEHWEGRALKAESTATPVPGVSEAFEGTVDGDTPLQAAAREAGWALMEIVDSIDWTKREQVSDIVSRLGQALNHKPAALEAAVQSPPAGVRVTDEIRGQIAYQLTKRMVIDMPTARACVDDALVGFVPALASPVEAVATEPVALDVENIKGRAASVICEVGALCGWPGPDCKSTEAAQALFDAGLLAAPTGDSGALREALEKIATLNRSRDQLQEIARAALASGEKAR